MRTLTTILIFTYLKIMYAVGYSNTDDTRKLLTDSDITLDEAAEQIAEIKSNEVLPLILFTNFIEIQSPNDLEFVVTKHRRIVNETKFISINPGIQRFLCPTLNSDKKCFVAMKFEEWQTLKCPEIEKATPIFLEENGHLRCGSDKVGRLYTVTYDICPEEELHHCNKEDVWFYLVCYDENKEKTLFTGHTIMEPKLLNSKLLLRERQIKYPMMTNDQIKTNPSNYEGGLLYKVQLLVPPEDMPFALWSRTTYQYVNAELQHIDLIPLWNKINEYIRSYAMELYLNTRGATALYIYTGVVEMPSRSIDDNQKSNMWVKMVSIYGNPPQPGIAILMNNFIDTDTKEDEYFKSSETDKLIDRNQDEYKSSEENLKRYCEIDLCVSDLKEKFENVKGHIRCCALTPKVAKLFGIEKYDGSNPEILHIPSINEVNEYEPSM